MLSYMIRPLLGVVVAASLTVVSHAFVVSNVAPSMRLSSLETERARSTFTSLAATATKSTLTEETSWDFQFNLRGIPTLQGKKCDEIFRVTVQFHEDINYEPPQGSVEQMDLSQKENDNDQEEKQRFQIIKSRWQLSEDPNDRKDGLWVWGLFAEPLYPFLLLQMETEAIPLPGEDNDSIAPLQLYCKINHRRDKELGAILDERTDLQVRVKETVKADLLGVSNVELFEEVSVGTLGIKPL